MKDSLDDFIKENREAFDDQEPSERIWSAVSRSLPEKKRWQLWDSTSIWRAAAALLFALSVYLLATRGTTPVEKAPAHAQAEFSSLEYFYRTEIAAKAKLISDLDSGKNEQFTQDFKKLDAMYLVLSDELKNHPSEKVRDAMILNLLVRVDLLNQQLKRLEDIRSKRKDRSSEV